MINWLAYIDLNPIRDRIVNHPEDYRGVRLGIMCRPGNKDKFLSTLILHLRGAVA